MIKEFVPEMRSDKKDAEIARLREQVRMWKDFAIEFRNDGNVADKDYSLVDRFDAALEELNMKEHTCSYYCERPECIRAQRDELRDRLEKVDQEGAVAVGSVEQRKDMTLCGKLIVSLPIGTKLYTRPHDPALAERLTDAFLGWKLPDDFSPDHFISFDRERALDLKQSTAGSSWPTGTNLFTATQVRQMFEQLLAAALGGAK